MVTKIPFPREFTPERLPLRGELTAWLLTLVVLGTATFLRVYTAQWANIALILAIIFVLSATSISFGNWMDRKTIIRLTPDGISFANGLRLTELDWKEVQEVRIFPAQWGARQVQVVGESPRGKVHFEFRTLGTVKYQGQQRGQTGFSDGDFILETIIHMANIHPVPSENSSYSYYARK